MNRKLWIPVFCALSCVPFLVAHQAEADLNLPAGYQKTAVLSVPPSAFLGGMDYLAGGDLVYFDGSAVRRFSGTAPGALLFDPPGTVWGSFVKVLSADTIYFGENADMRIYRVYASGGGTQTAIVQNNFDLENYGTELYISYNASSGPPPGNPEGRVAKITLPGGALDTILGNTGGYSGPVAFDEGGNMYYCVPNPNFAQPGVTGLYYFTRAQVLGAMGPGELTLEDGEYLGNDLIGCYDMEYDDQVGRLFVTTGNDFTAQIQIWDAGTGAVSTFATKTPGTFYSTYLRFRPGSRPFSANNGPNAGTLSVVQNGTVYEIRPDPYWWFAATPAEAAVAAGGDPGRSVAANLLGLLFLPAVAVALLLTRARRGRIHRKARRESRFRAIILPLLLVVECLAFGEMAQAGPYTEPGVASDDPAIVGWASGWVNEVRGPMDIANPEGGVASFGSPENALGPATCSVHDVISLGDGGELTLTFDPPITNGTGYDLVVFENGFFSGGRLFAELAFVEVSTDGITFARFPSVSLTPGPVGGFGTIDPSDVFHLAGKHPGGNQSPCEGTGFDLADLAGDPAVLSGAVDLNRIHYVKVVDVIGDGSTQDANGNPVYDPYPTPFASSGFDLQAVGVLNQLAEPPLWDGCPPVQAATLGSSSHGASRCVNALLLFVVPAAVILVRLRRRSRG